MLITYRRFTRPSPTSEPPPPEGSQPRPAIAACRGPTASCSSDRVSRPRRPRSRSTRPGPSARILCRFEDIAFDHYGYFSQDLPLTTTTTSTTPTVASTTAFTVTLPPVSAGNLIRERPLLGPLGDCHPDIDRRGRHTGGCVGDSHRPRRRGPTIVGLQKQNPSLPYNATTNPLVVFYQLENVSPLLGRPDYPDHAQGVVSDFAPEFRRVHPDRRGHRGRDTRSDELHRFGAIHHVLGGWHNPVGLGRSRHLAVQDHGKPG